MSNGSMLSRGKGTGAVSIQYLDPLIQKLLQRRGISEEDAFAFLNPDYEKHMNDPLLMRGMETAVARILEAIGKNERIGIFSDYDADGIPGAVILHDFFKKIGFLNFEHYIPSRHDEGFGLNKEAVTTLSKNGAKLLITVDCGIADAAEIAHANTLGMEVIVTDHHEAHDVLPDALAILNPKQPLCSYPDKNLCGAGVVFKLIQAIVSRIRSSAKGQLPTIPEGWEKWLLDMAGLATLSDMVPLIGENRVLARYGLLVLRKTTRPGLQQLFQKLKVTQRFLNEDDIGFLVTPRINAASRMGEAKDAFSLLACRDLKEAGAYVERLNQINDERKGLVASISKEAHQLIAQRYGEQIPKVLVLGNPNWRPSLLGLVANALVEKHHVPVFLWGRSGDGTIKGSCRAPEGGGLLEIMRKTPPGTFEDFGGHAASGGFSISSERIHTLGEALLEAAAQYDGTLKSILVPDASLRVDDVTSDLLRNIEMLAPFGIGNPKPVFLFEESVVEEIMLFGKEKNHVKLKIKSAGGNRSIEAINFFGAHLPWVSAISPGRTATIMASAEKSYFRGFAEIRLRIIDVS